MKAAVVEEYKKPLVIEDVPDPSNDAKGVIVELQACGVCRSDWWGWQGDWPDYTAPLPHIYGHEFVGRVCDAGSEVNNFHVDDRVIVPFTVGCGHCDYCQSGRSNLCRELEMPGFSYNGGFAEYVHVPNADANLLTIPEELGYTQAASLGCRYMTSYHGLVRVGQVEPGDWVAVYGAGGIGLAATQIASAVGALPVVVARHDEKLQLAKKVGAAAVVNGVKTNPVEAIKEITGGGADLSVDAVGARETMLNGINSLKAGGTHVQIGMLSEGAEGEVPLTVDPLIISEIAIKGSWGMPAVEFPKLLNQVAAGKLNPGALVTGEIPLSRINEPLDAMTSFNTLGIKVITDFAH